MTPPTDSSASDLDLARQQLHEAIEASRAIVRQTYVLIELSECDGVAAANDNGLPFSDQP